MDMSVKNDKAMALAGLLQCGHLVSGIARNGLVAEDEIMNAQTLPQVRMPNAEGFIDQSHIQ